MPKPLPVVEFLTYVVFSVTEDTVIIIITDSSEKVKMKGKERSWRGEEDLGGAGGPLERGPPTLQTSLTSRELPPRPRLLKSKNLICFFEWRGRGGSFSFRVGGGMYIVRLSHPFGGWGCRGNDPCVVPFRLEDTC